MSITVIKECTKNIPNCYKLIQVAAKRARIISTDEGGAYATTKDKSTIRALEEIRDGITTEASVNDIESFFDQSRDDQAL